ncbi:hypothetical protein [Polaromonas sp. DSR2-3-2]|uniref:hypothetical protein n=1 Tax=unclassified Polaromonas TaxID=2638319 RepID=UPI003CFB9AD2
MTPGQAGAAPSMLLGGRFSGRSEFAGLVRQAMAAAAAQGWREMIWCDPDFGDWPLGERAVAQALNDWAGGGRKLTLLAEHYDAVLRQHARFVTWRRTWAHVVECRKSGAASRGCLPSAFWSPAWVFERLDSPRCTGVAGADLVRRIALKERLSEHLSSSSAGFPATVLGL